ncbi:uncharacterized protein LOC142823409 [Pelodiscus sinensis]|uniref:uncharacterized protein LOC142823409 n=1 Tax=Pelodiscus sinensis TaxID=13735 RepID=UPI003F6B1C99
MIPLLLLWLCWVHFTNQEICSSPGNLSAPQLLLDKTSSEEGVSLVLKCKVPALSPFSRVIFCKDGKDLGSWPMQETKFAYSYRVSVNNTGRFTCLYQHKDDQNQEKNSLLSDSQNLDVTDATPTSNRNVTEVQPLPNVLLKRRDTRKHGPSEEIPKSPEDQIEYSTTIGFDRASTQGSQPSGDTAVTCTTVGPCTDQTAGLSPAGETDDLHPYGTGEHTWQVRTPLRRDLGHTA